MTEHEKYVETLIAKAVNNASADSALKFSQAACNAANALRVLTEMKYPKISIKGIKGR